MAPDRSIVLELDTLTEYACILPICSNCLLKGECNMNSEAYYIFGDNRKGANCGPCGINGKCPIFIMAIYPKAIDLVNENDGDLALAVMDAKARRDDPLNSHEDYSNGGVYSFLKAVNDGTKSLQIDSDPLNILAAVFSLMNDDDDDLF